MQPKLQARRPPVAGTSRPPSVHNAVLRETFKRGSDMVHPSITIDDDRMMKICSMGFEFIVFSQIAGL
jgi:hypothetical protein